jgi:NADH:ubiquinone oxidoreductase subunit C
VVKKNISLLITFFKFDWLHQFTMCVDILAYDQPGKKLRFTVIYYLLSLTYNTRLHLVTQLGDLQGLETVYMLYKSANWSERELWDMFGILIFYHPDLRRILTDYGFAGFPLRKNFPVSGYKELFYSEFIKNTKYRAVELLQARRDYIYSANWVKKKKVEIEKEPNPRPSL